MDSGIFLDQCIWNPITDSVMVRYLHMVKGEEAGSKAASSRHSHTAGSDSWPTDGHMEGERSILKAEGSGAIWTPWGPLYYTAQN